MQHKGNMIHPGRLRGLAAPQSWQASARTEPALACAAPFKTCMGAWLPRKPCRHCQAHTELIVGFCRASREGLAGQTQREMLTGLASKARVTAQPRSTFEASKSVP